jgi:hypothetical protein
VPLLQVANRRVLYAGTAALVSLILVTGVSVLLQPPLYSRNSISLGSAVDMPMPKPQVALNVVSKPGLKLLLLEETCQEPTAW